MVDDIVRISPHADYLLLFLEDFLLKGTVSTARIVELVQVARKNKVGCLRLAGGLPLALPPSRPLPDFPGVGEIASGEPYRVTLQVAIWRIDTLRRLLAPGLSAWEFETIGTHLSEGLDEPFWGVTRPTIEYDHAIEKGKWKHEGIRILQSAGLEPETLQRGVHSDEELGAHYERSRQESASSEYRSAALRSFLVGQRKEGLRHVLRGIRQGNWSFLDLLLVVVGSFGRTVTKKALSIYVGWRLREHSRREATSDTPTT
jgi:hypothetical protein